MTANYFHLTHPSRPPLRRAQCVANTHLLAGRQPGFRQVLDTADSSWGARSAATATPGALTAGRRVAPRVAALSVPAPPDRHHPPARPRWCRRSLVMSLAGTREGGMVQYLVAAGVMKSFSEPTSSVISYLRRARRVLCHRGGPHCGGSADELATPVAALHVRHGDSCDRMRTQSGSTRCGAATSTATPPASATATATRGPSTSASCAGCSATTTCAPCGRHGRRDGRRAQRVATRARLQLGGSIPRAQFAKRVDEFRADLDGTCRSPWRRSCS